MFRLIRIKYSVSKINEKLTSNCIFTSFLSIKNILSLQKNKKTSSMKLKKFDVFKDELTDHSFKKKEFEEENKFLSDEE